MIVVAVALAGGFGAGVRFLVDNAIHARNRFTFPLGTLFVNATGSLLLGILTGLTLSSGLPPTVQTVVGTGFLGGFTTFSTASIELALLVRNGRREAAVVLGLGMLLVSLVTAAVGFVAAGAM